MVWGWWWISQTDWRESNPQLDRQEEVAAAEVQLHAAMVDECPRPFSLGRDLFESKDTGKWLSMSKSASEILEDMIHKWLVIHTGCQWQIWVCWNFLEHGGMRYVQDVTNVSQNVRDMQRALLDLALLTEAPPELGPHWLYSPSLKVESVHQNDHPPQKDRTYCISCSRSGIWTCKNHLVSKEEVISSEWKNYHWHFQRLICMKP